LEETLLPFNGFKFVFELLFIGYDRAQIALGLCDGLPEGKVPFEKEETCDQRYDGNKYHLFNREMGLYPLHGIESRKVIQR
jgi:hypothetical protein